jgi:hypothetical protein
MVVQMSDDGPLASGGAKTSTLLGSLPIKNLLEDYLKMRSEKIGTMSAEDLRELSKHELNAVERIVEIVKKDDHAFDVAPLTSEVEFKKARVERGETDKDKAIYDDPNVTWDIFHFQDRIINNQQTIATLHHELANQNQVKNLGALHDYLVVRGKVFEGLGDNPAPYRQAYETEQSKLNDLLIQEDRQVSPIKQAGLDADGIVAGRVNENLGKQATKSDVATQNKDPEI